MRRGLRRGEPRQSLLTRRQFLALTGVATLAAPRKPWTLANDALRFRLIVLTAKWSRRVLPCEARRMHALPLEFLLEFDDGSYLVDQPARPAR